MSIASEITRLQQAKADIKTAIENKGVTVADNAKLDTYAGLVNNIVTATPSIYNPFIISETAIDLYNDGWPTTGITFIDTTKAILDNSKTYYVYIFPNQWIMNDITKVTWQLVGGNGESVTLNQANVAISTYIYQDSSQQVIGIQCVLTDMNTFTTTASDIYLNIYYDGTIIGRPVFMSPNS